MNDLFYWKLYPYLCGIGAGTTPWKVSLVLCFIHGRG